MINVQSLRSEIVGDSNAKVHYEFAVAILNYAGWRPEAYSIDANNKGLVETFYWIQGNLIGKLSAEGDPENPETSCTLYPVSEICKLGLKGNVVETARGDEFHRALSIYFRGSDQIAITVDVNDHDNQTLRGHADGFIKAVLRRFDEPGDTNAQS